MSRFLQCSKCMSRIYDTSVKPRLYLSTQYIHMSHTLFSQLIKLEVGTKLLKGLFLSVVQFCVSLELLWTPLTKDSKHDHFYLCDLLLPSYIHVIAYIGLHTCYYCTIIKHSLAFSQLKCWLNLLHYHVKIMIAILIHTLAYWPNSNNGYIVYKLLTGL